MKKAFVIGREAEKFFADRDLEYPCGCRLVAEGTGPVAYEYCEHDWREIVVEGAL